MAQELTETGLTAESVRGIFGLPEQDLRQYSPLTLAFIGDTVYETIVRSMVVLRGQRPAKALHREKVRYVSAPAQAQIVARIEDKLTDEEREILRRGRSTKTGSSARNASLADYHLATGLEALCGYLYLKGETARLLALLREGFGESDEG
ncbi:MAG: ribonuclease III [Butyrivibrio sp.]|nr:ribonuclease III [Butyrivibrio sp.]